MTGGWYRYFIYGLLVLFLTAAPTDGYANGQKNGQKNAQRGQHAYQKSPRHRKDNFTRPRDRREKFLKKKFRHNAARQALKSGRIVSLSVIRGRIRQSFPGKIVDVRLLEPRGSNRPYIYAVKLLRKDGRLLLLRINAANARILSVKGNN